VLRKQVGIRHARIKKKGSLAARTAVIIDLVASAAQKADAERYLGRCDANFDNFRQWEKQVIA